MRNVMFLEGDVVSHGLSWAKEFELGEECDEYGVVIDDKGQIDDGKRWQSTRTLDVGTKPPNEPNGPFCGQLEMALIP